MILNIQEVTFFVHILLGYFCMHVPMDLGRILVRIWGRFWDDFSRNVELLRGEKMNKKYMKKSSRNAPEMLPTWRRRTEIRKLFSHLIHVWGTFGTQHGAKTCPKRLLGLSWDGFGTVTFLDNFGSFSGAFMTLYDPTQARWRGSPSGTWII